MRRPFFLFIVLLTVAQFSFSQARPYNVVFDLTSGDTNNHKSMIRMIKLIKQTNPDANFEVVFYGQSLGMVMKDKSILADEIQKIISSDKKTHFVVCEMAMKRQNIEKSQLLPGVETVPDGVYEIFTKQAQGFGYIKVAQ